MGWDVSLERKEQPVSVLGHQSGSNLVAEVDANGKLSPIDNDVADCCITYNYDRLYSLAGFSMEDLNEKRAQETVSDLRDAVEKLGTKRDENYWKDTPGNAGFVLSKLLEWAEQNPDAIWKVT